MKLISWNTNRRVQAAEAQVAALLGRRPDVVALQEVTTRTGALLKAGLRSGGLEHVAFSMDSTAVGLARGPRSFGVLIASRSPITVLPGLPIPWKEKALSVVVGQGSAVVEIHTVHVPPGSSNLWVKVEVLEGVARGLAGAATRPRILCGDFNAPQAETSAGVFISWAQRIVGDKVTLRTRFRGGSGARWDSAERVLLRGGLIDAFRVVHGYNVVESSWYLSRRGKLIGRRFDHILVSPQVRIERCEYRHQWRLDGLSDHSAIEADLEAGGTV